MVLVVYAKNLCGRHLSASAMRELYLLLQENTADEQAHRTRRVVKGSEEMESIDNRSKREAKADRYDECARVRG